MAKKRPLVTAKSKDQAAAIGLSKKKKSGGSDRIVAYEVTQYKKGKKK